MSEQISPWGTVSPQSTTPLLDDEGVFEGLDFQQLHEQLDALGSAEEEQEPSEEWSVVDLARAIDDHVIQGLQLLGHSTPTACTESAHLVAGPDVHAPRNVVYKGKTLEEVLGELPSSIHKDDRYLIAYLVALGIARLHVLGLCHMNVKAKHVEIGVDESSSLMYGRLVDGSSVVSQGAGWRQTTPKYLDLDCGTAITGLQADFAHDMWAFGILLYDLLHGPARNPIHGLQDMSRETWRAAVRQLRVTLSSTDPADRLIAALLGPSDTRPTAQRAVQALCDVIGGERCRQWVSATEASQAVEKIVVPSSAQIFVQKNRCAQPPQRRQTLCRLMYHVAASMAQLHKKKLVHMSICPEHIRVYWDGIAGGLSGHILYVPGCVPAGRNIQKAASHYVDFGQCPGLMMRKASPADDCWALGITMLELWYGSEANLFRSVAFDERADQIDKGGWERAIHSVRQTLTMDEPIDRIILGLLQPRATRVTAEQAVEALSEILDVETAQSVLFSSRHPQQWKERVAIAYGIARDFVERAPDFYLTITPQTVELLRNPATQEMIGARIIGEIPRLERVQLQDKVSDPYARCFGLLLCSLFYGGQQIVSAIDYEHLPPVQSVQWQRVVEAIREIIRPEASHEVVAQIIWLLLTDGGFCVENSFGIFQRLLEGTLPPQVHLRDGFSLRPMEEGR